MAATVCRMRYGMDDLIEPIGRWVAYILRGPPVLGGGALTAWLRV